MQSGKFFSDDVLKKLGVLNEDSQVDEAPLGFGAGLATRLSTMLPGQSSRAMARGKLEAGKIANNLYQNYYQWLGRNNLQPTEQSIIDFLTSNNIPTGKAQTMLTRPQATAGSAPASQDVQRGQFNAPQDTGSANKVNIADPSKSFSSPPAKSTANKVNIADPSKSFSSPPAKSTATVPQTDKKNSKAFGKRPSKPGEQFPLSPPSAPAFGKRPRPVSEENLNDILRLSGLSEIVTEQLSKKAIDAAFMAAAGEFLDKGYTQLPPAAAAPPGQTPLSTDGGGSGQASSTGDGSGQASSTSGSGRGQSSSTGGGDTANATVSGDAMSEFTDWLNKNRNNKKVLGKAKEEIEKTLSRYSAAGAASAGTPPADKSASSGLVTTNPTTPTPGAKTGS